jgi:indolepyruvate ferredoxin oxidoreductase alpha subunit
LGDGAARISLEAAVRGLGVDRVYAVDPFDEEETLGALKEAKRGTGVNVVICHSPCTVHERRSRKGESRPPFVVDQERCNACSLCVRVLGCPAILVTDGRYAIDQELCDGCELCAQVCKQGAIRQAASVRT